MASAGLMFAFLRRKLVTPRKLGAAMRDPISGLLSRGFGLTAIFGLFLAESNLAQMWGRLVLVVMSLYVATRALSA
ncbi:MAG: hypothetical protein ACI8PT_003320 [Gammaproteobacteria bacterium]|jgi:hypothetical protein